MTYTPQRCAVCGELESSNPAWAGTHRYGPVEHGPFEHPLTCTCEAEDRGIPCSHCRETTGDVEEQYDRYGIYAGRWHDACWRSHGYGGFVFDPDYAGESLEGEDY